MRPELKTLEAAFNQVETRYRFIKNQQETILDRLVNEDITSEEEPLLTTKKLGDKVKVDFLQIALKFAAYQKDQDSTETSSKDSETLKTLTASMSSMTSAVTKMADRPLVFGFDLKGATITGTNMGRQSQILCYLEKRIQSLDEEILSR